MTTDTTEEIAVLARLAALPAAWVTCELHDAAINSRSAVLIGLWSLSAQFRIRIAQNVADTRKEIPGKCPGVSAVRPGFVNCRPPSAVATSIYCVIDPFSGCRQRTVHDADQSCRRSGFRSAA
jgi:hypothetical protein